MIFIMSDDHTSQAIGAYGSHLAALNPTPNIDRLAKEGMRFDRVFCHNSICTPSRANIISGQYSQRNGVLILGNHLAPEKELLPAQLKKAGYQTAVIGKWHLGVEPVAFDYYCVLPGQGHYFDPTFRVRGEKPWPDSTIQIEGKHSSDTITDLGLGWLKDKRDTEKPFFLALQYKAPHDMWENAKRYDDYLKDVVIPSPANRDQPLNGSVATRGMGSGMGKDASWYLGKRLGMDPSLPADAYRDATYQTFIKRYLRCVKGVDDNLKRLFAYLEANDLMDNTIIVYTADQGVFLGEHDLMDKRWMYEEAMHMPFIVHWPAVVKAGQTNDWLINNVDFAPTLLELAEAEIPESMQGRSFAGALRGEPKPDDWRKYTYYRYWMHMAHHLTVPGHFGIRGERYKLIFFYGRDLPDGRFPPTPAAWEFYDLKNDPHEMHNQVSNPEYEKVISDMKVALKQIRKALGETDETYPEIQKVIDENGSK